MRAPQQPLRRTIRPLLRREQPPRMRQIGIEPLTMVPPKRRRPTERHPSQLRLMRRKQQLPRPQQRPRTIMLALNQITQLGHAPTPITPIRIKRSLQSLVRRTRAPHRTHG